MYTVITKGNEVRQYPDIDSIECSVDGPFLAINSCSGSKVAFTEDDPITWPADATSGLQAIVDVKAGTLRFGMNNGPLSRDEFVVSEYASVESVASAPHIFDQVDNWPEKTLYCREPELPEGWMWQWCWGNDWVLSNGTIGLKREDWFKYKFGDAEPVKSFGAVEDSAPVHVLDLIKEWPSAANSPAALPDLPGFKWMFHDGGVWSICGMNGDTEFFEGHWLNYHENKKKYANDHCGDEGIELTYSNPVTAASMLTAALGHMEDRAKTYDAPGGERSMGKTVAAFNTITGHTLTEEAGWLFMILLKAVRAQTDKTLDSLEDMVAYSALLGEAQSKRKNGEKSS